LRLEWIETKMRRAAADESRHYDWAAQSLEALDASRDDLDVRATTAFAEVRGRTADGVESVERATMQVAERARRTVQNHPFRAVVTAGLAVVGAGVLLKRVLDRR
jgi:ElaB/YqjD/DUF883 family membrane-anchored ribosome-binding protein